MVDIVLQYNENDFLPKAHMYAKAPLEKKDMSTQTNVTLTAEKGVKVKTEAGTMSAVGNIQNDSDSLLYTGVTNEFFFWLTEAMEQENTLAFN